VHAELRRVPQVFIFEVRPPLEVRPMSGLGGTQGPFPHTPLDIEDDLSIVGVDDGFASNQEWSSQYDLGIFTSSGFHYYKVYR